MVKVDFFFFGKTSGIREQCLQISKIIETIADATLVKRAISDSFNIIIPEASVFEIIILGFNAPEANEIIKNNSKLLNCKKIILYCAWELCNIDPGWDYTYFDEIWTISEFSKQGLMLSSSIPPVIVVQSPILEIGIEPYDYKLPVGFRFLVCFDYLSDIYRKNIKNTIDIFDTICNKYPYVFLIVKSTHSEKVPRLAAELKKNAHKNVVFIDDNVSIYHSNYLKTLCNAYVSLHRAEGWGRNIMEMLFLGKAIVSSFCSGEREFLTEHNAFLVDCSQVLISECSQFSHITTDDATEKIYIAGLYKTLFKDTYWGDPDINQAIMHIENIILYGGPSRMYLDQDIAFIEEKIRKSILIAQDTRGQKYIKRYPDLPENGIISDSMAFNHWQKYGKLENRIW